ncbi:hypothetical protein J5N97_026160 [Dioscorea zingiberensis]|uniref:Uncharacterized protein n=1 Tax=Dioscorea zingiberensis TaxID=325984 RepID=A0A9D5C2N6_9LILI|nr:hypothetical protein J5N97_026160 [Dioscorea zingiberensis]
MVAVEDLARKLSLWDTRRFRPIMTHDDLEPIMETAGFVPVLDPTTPTNGKVVWREYVYRGRVTARAAGRRPAAPEGMTPRLRLPFPRLDGLHLFAYKAFFVAFGFYVGADRVADYFHVRAMSLSRANDRVFDRDYRPMRDSEMDDEGIILYRESTRDQIIESLFSYDINNLSDTEDENGNNTNIVGNKNNDNISSNKNATNSISIVPLKDLFPQKVA